MKVAIFAPWMPEYRLPFYVKLLKIVNNEDVEIKIYASTPPSYAEKRNDHIKELSYVNYLNKFQFKIGNRSFEFYNPLLTFIKADLIIVEHTIRNSLIYFFLLFRRKKLAFWGHSKTYTTSKSRLEEKWKLYIAKKSRHYFAYTLEGKEFLIRNGMDSEKITVVNNSTDISRFTLENSMDSNNELIMFLEKVGLTVPPTCIFLGSLVAEKHLPFLLAAAKKIKSSIPDFSLLIFGSGPLEEWLESKQNEYIRMAGRATDQILCELKSHVQIILNPGLVGLVAVDSFALGIPIVTTNLTFHAPEYSYLKNKINSITSEFDENDFANEVINLLRDPKKLEQLKINCIEEAKNYGTDKMAYNFKRGVFKAIGIREEVQ